MPLHPQVIALVDAMAASSDVKPTHEQTPKEARDGYRALTAMFGPAPDVAAVDDRTIPGPACEIPIRTYRPAGDDRDCPVPPITRKLTNSTFVASERS